MPGRCTHACPSAFPRPRPPSLQHFGVARGTAALPGRGAHGACPPQSPDRVERAPRRHAGDPPGLLGNRPVALLPRVGKSIKDTKLRYKSMKGTRTKRRPVMALYKAIMWTFAGKN